MGEKTAAAGIRFGYHNHVREFAVTDGKTPYMELLQLTDPKKVTFELDCGWAVVAGMNPVEIMKTIPIASLCFTSKTSSFQQHP